MKYTCPSCGYLTFENTPGSYDICEICFWEDDLSQLRFANTKGANKVTLIQAQKNFQKFGASVKEFVHKVRKPKQGDIRDTKWRIIDQTKDNIEIPIEGKKYEDSYPKNITKFYYWLDE